MQKYIRDGKVGLLISPGYGAGWSTWNSQEIKDNLLMGKDMVEAFFVNGLAELNRVVNETYPEDTYVCKLGMKDVILVWVPEGSLYLITEHDGFETLITEEDMECA